VTVVQDLFLEDAPPARIAGSLDGKPTTHDGYIVVRDMRAIDGLDATILVKADRAIALSVWYRDIEKPTLAAAQTLFGAPTLESNRLFELVFARETRALDRGGKLVISCSANGAGLLSTERFLVGIALTVNAA